MLVSIALDPLTGDLALNERGQSYLVYGKDALIQNIQAAFSFGKGEWFLDLRQGVPWIDTILGQKSVSFRVLNSIWRQILLSRPGVLSVTSLETVWYSREDRTAQVNFEVDSDEGTVNSFDYSPLIIKVPSE